MRKLLKTKWNIFRNSSGLRLYRRSPCSFKTKENLRVLKLSNIEDSLQGFDLKYLDGKLLVQDRDEKLINEYKNVTVNEADEKMKKIWNLEWK